MRILFVYQGFECLALECLSAVLKQHGHTTRLAFDPALFNDMFVKKPSLAQIFDVRAQMVREAREFKPDLIAFGVLSPFFRWAAALAKDMKEALGVPIVFGGIHVSGAPDQTMARPWIDYAVVGEGEYPLLGLVEHLEGKRSLESVPNLIWRRQDGSFTELVKNPLEPFRPMSDFPWPDKALFTDVSPHFLWGYSIAGSRGCPMRCTFCTESMMANISANGDKGYLRRRTVEDMIEELQWAKKRYNINHIRLYDDILTWDRAWFGHFAEQMKTKINVPYWCFIYPSVVDEWTVKTLEESGCYEVEMGIQSPSEKTRREIFGRRETNEHVKRALSLLGKSKINCMADTLVGVPGQTEQDLRDAVMFYSEHRPNHLNAFWLTYFPGTRITEIAQEMGSLSQEQVDQIHAEPHARTFYDKRPGDTRELQKLQNYLQAVLYIPKSWHSFILKHSLYRYFPAMDALFMLVIAIRLIWRKEGRYPHLEGRLIRKYLRFIPRILWRRFVGGDGAAPLTLSAAAVTLPGGESLPAQNSR